MHIVATCVNGIIKIALDFWQNYTKVSYSLVHDYAQPCVVVLLLELVLFIYFLVYCRRQSYLVLPYVITKFTLIVSCFTYMSDFDNLLLVIPVVAIILVDVALALRIINIWGYGIYFRGAHFYFFH